MVAKFLGKIELFLYHYKANFLVSLGKVIFYSLEIVLSSIDLGLSWS